MAVVLRFKPGKATAPVFAYSVALLAKYNVKLVRASNEIPELVVPSNGGITTVRRDMTIARFIARTATSGLCSYPADAAGAAAIDEWVEFSSSASPSLALLNAVLASRAFLVGYSVSLADVAVYYAIVAKNLDTSAFPNVARWASLCSAATPWQRVMRELGALAPTRGAGAGKGAKGTKGAKKGAASGKRGLAKGVGAGKKLAFGCPPLKDAVEGQVVTRFPPEPSGYLHIGHVKAIMLNNFYAKHYKGKLLVRFDDTNPSKEKEEFEQSILADLKSLDVVPDMMSHTSDHFDLIKKYALKLITDGNGYMCDLPVEKMRADRMVGTDSPRRNTTVEENLERFHEMYSGSEEGQKWCLRAKIDMQAKNKTLRDPVMFRCNLEPHARTGTKYKAYPTYDFACPIVDSVEGVTNALRTTEYRDRLAQYQWVQKVLGVRPVNVYEFSRQSFIYTTLSKRKLGWFVNQNLVDGWDDPRFPTVQGVLRRGCTVEGLRKFLLAQGASRRIIEMEWDRFWSDNKKILDPKAKRFVAVDATSRVRVTLSNVAGPSTLTAPFHNRNPDLGTKVIQTGPVVWIEGDDAARLSVGQEIVLMKWNTAVVEEIVRDGDRIVDIKARFAPGGDFKKSVKLTWVCDSPHLVKFNIMEYDFLLTKKKLEEGDQLKDFVNKHTVAQTTLIGEPGLRNLQHGQVIQLERRAMFRVDQVHVSNDRPLTLIMIPDGKKKSMSTLSTKLTHR